jgi:uncharacterized lipoprotein YddW (UPF0748 family)
MRKLNLLVVFALVLAMFSCKNEQKYVQNSKIWTWMSLNKKDSDQKLDSLFSKMAETGIGGVLIHETEEALMKKGINLAKKYGMKVHIWMITLQNPGMKKKHPEWMSVNRQGKSLAEQKAYVDYYSFMCPILPGVKKYIREKVANLCKYDVEAISLDYCRFVDVILPDALWGKYDLVQDHEMPEYDYGYHPEIRKAFKEKYGVDPMEIKDPAKDKNWLQFRYDLITEIAHIAREEAHKHGKMISASPFPTPTLGRKHTRQAWEQWNLDMVFPMTYHAFYHGDEKWFQACIDENLKSGVKKGIFNGLYVPAFHGDSHEVENSNPHVTLESLMRTSFDQGMGVCFFTYTMLNKEERAVVRKLAIEYK